MNRTLLVTLFLCSCACPQPNWTVRPNKDQYVLVQTYTNNRQRFDYILNPSYEVRQFSKDVEIWNEHNRIETIKGPCSVTIGPRQ